MKFPIKNRKYKQIALALSLCALVVWCVFGTGTSLAWFMDTTPEISNIFHFADFEVEVSHRLTDGNWEQIDGKTDIFDKEALYEPGYVQVVYLKVENKGSVSFKFYTAVNVNGYATATNVFDETFNLQDHLRFGITTADSEDAMKASVPSREAAVQIANEPLHNYDETGAFELAPKATKYIALIVRMPEDVNNVANYRGDDPPTVELGITIKAEQIQK